MFSLKTTVIEKWQFVFSELYQPTVMTILTEPTSALQFYSDPFVFPTRAQAGQHRSLHTTSSPSQITVIFGIYILLVVSLCIFTSSLHPSLPPSLPPSPSFPLSLPPRSPAPPPAGRPRR